MRVELPAQVSDWLTVWLDICVEVQTTQRLHIRVSIITKPQSHQSSVGTSREATHLTSVAVCLTLAAQIALRDSSPAEDSPAVSHSLVLTKTLTFNGVLVILDVSLVTVAVWVLRWDYSAGINFNTDSHATENLSLKKLLPESPASACGVQVIFKVKNHLQSLSLPYTHTVLTTAFPYTTSPGGENSNYMLLFWKFGIFRIASVALIM